MLFLLIFIREEITINMKKISILILTAMFFVSGCTDNSNISEVEINEEYMDNFLKVKAIYDTDNGYIQEIPDIEKGDLYSTYHTYFTLKNLDEKKLNKDTLKAYIKKALSEVKANESQANDKIYYAFKMYEELNYNLSSEEKKAVVHLLNQLITEKGEVLPQVGETYTDASLVYQAIYVFNQLGMEIPSNIIQWLEKHNENLKLYELLSLYDINLILENDNSTLIKKIQDSLHNNPIHANADIIEKKLYFELYKILNMDEEIEELEDRILKLKNNDGGWGLIKGDASDVLSTNFAIQILSADNKKEKYNSTIELVNIPSTFGGYTHIIQGEADIISNFYATTIDKKLNQENNKIKTIQQYAENQLGTKMKTFTPFEVYLLMATLTETQLKKFKEKHIDDIEKYIKNNSEIYDPIQLFYISKVISIVDLKGIESIKEIIENQLSIMINRDNTEDMEETIKIFSELVRANINGENTSNININDFDQQKIINELDTNGDLLYIFITESNWDSEPIQQKFLEKKLTDYEELLKNYFTSKLFYEYILISEKVSELS